MKKPAGKKLNARLTKKLAAGLKDGIAGKVNGQDKAKHGAWSPPPPLDLKVLQSQVAPTTLNEAEQDELRRCEDTIRGGWQSFVEVGEALTHIQVKQLYRDRYKTFEDYYRTEWQYQKSQIYRLIDAARVVKILSPIGEDRILPCNESQIRPLLGLREDQIRNVWIQVSEEVGGDAKRITARLVQKQVRSIIPESAAPKRGGEGSSPPPGTTLNRIDDILDRLVAMAAAENRMRAEHLRADLMSLVKTLVKQQSIPQP